MTTSNDTHEWIDATYSAEDNKLRLYCASRLDEDLYKVVREAGFRWAPKQELFVAPSWTPAREDLCIELAGEIDPEGTTLAERAQMKAERLDGYAERRASDANAFQNAAHDIGRRFAGGQPILIGHHSERRARKDRERMDNNMQRAVKASKLADYWASQAESVEHHANYKNRPDVRARRIKTLLKELRDHQRALNNASLALDRWQQIAASEAGPKRDAMIEHLAGYHMYSPYFGLWDELRSGKKTPDEAVTVAIQRFTNSINSTTRQRWIEHTLNRLGYETAMLGEVPRFTGELSATLLQAFCRTHGADKPKAVKTKTGWKVTSDVPLPAHIGRGKELELTIGGWRDLMKACGYDVEANRPKKTARSTVPLLNVKVATLKANTYGRETEYPMAEMTKAEYADIYRDYKGVRIHTSGLFRFRTTMQNGGLVYVFLTDSKQHPLPEGAMGMEAA